jgi:uncharacterized protein YjiS (DUF1127 family)
MPVAANRKCWLKNGRPRRAARGGHRPTNKQPSKETIMSTLTSTTEHAVADSGIATTILAALKRCWVTYMTWRIEMAAIATLRSMSEHDLNDLGISRSGIEDAVKVQR